MAKIYVKNTDGTYTPQSSVLVSNLDIVQDKGDSLTSAMSQKAVTDELKGKQDTISDLDAIRQGSEKGSTALQTESDPIYMADKPNLALKSELNGKVDKEDGKVLSSNDYTDAEKAKLSELGYNFGFLNEGYFTKESQSLSFTDGEYISLNASVGDVISLTPVSFSSATYAILNCQEGDIISAKGGLVGQGSRLVGFIDSSNVLLFVTEVGLVEGIFIAPKDTAKCIVNGSIGKASAVYGTNIEIAKWKNSVEELDSKITDLGHRAKVLEDGYNSQTTPLTFSTRAYIRLNKSIGEVVDLTPVKNSIFYCVVESCTEGKVVNAGGGIVANAARLVGFVDADNRLLFVSESGITEGTFIAPNGTNKVVVNGGYNEVYASIVTIEENAKWKDGLDELGDRLDSFEQSTNDRMESFQNKVFVQGANLFNVNTSVPNTGVSSINGTLISLPGYVTSDFIPVDPSTDYTFMARWVVAWYDENMQFLSSSSSSEVVIKTLTSPVGAKYMRFSFSLASYDPNMMMVNKGDSLLPFEPYGEQFNPAYLDDKNKCVGYGLEMVNIKKPNASLIGVPTNLCLIATKIIWEDGKTPNYTDYLYLDRTTQKLYISSGTPDNVQYLCDWDSSLVGGRDCKYYMATITSDGDIIFLRDHARENPVVYPHEDYKNPYIVNFADNKKPYGPLMHGSIVQFADGSFVFGDYAWHSLTDEQNNDGRIIWRVQKPYNNPDNWKIAHTFKHVYFESPISDEPDNEIGHIHAINYDFYNDVLYCTTGDIDRHCRLWYSLDKGETWGAVPNAVGWKQGDEGTGNSQSTGQKWRFTNMIFTKDCVYWCTDSFRDYHCLYKIQRGEDGVVNPETLEKVINLEMNIDSSMSQATYVTILLRNPYGLLIIDRAEPRTDGMLDVKFYDLSTERLYVIETLERATTDASSLDQETRIGLPNQCATLYQPETTDYVLIGGDTFIRPNNTSLFNNSIDNYVGALKMKVVAQAK